MRKKTFTTNLRRSVDCDPHSAVNESFSVLASDLNDTEPPPVQNVRRRAMVPIDDMLEAKALIRNVDEGFENQNRP